MALWNAEIHHSVPCHHKEGTGGLLEWVLTGDMDLGWFSFGAYMLSLACHQNTEVEENQFVNFSGTGGQLWEDSRGKNPRLRT